MHRWGRAGLALGAVVIAAPITLVGCTRIGECGAAQSLTPEVAVDVHPWIVAHPDTNVRICVGADCVTGYAEVTVEAPPDTAKPVDVVAEAMQGSAVTYTTRATETLGDLGCGQLGVRLELVGQGVLRVASSTPEP